MLAVLARLTPNLVVSGCRAGLAATLIFAVVAVPDGIGGPWLFFAISYAATLLAICAFPKVSGRYIGAGLAIMFCAFALLVSIDDPVMTMLVGMAGVVCALAPVYADSIGRRASAEEGHVSLFDRRATRRRRREATDRTVSRAAQAAPAYSAPAAPLLEYRAEPTS